MATPPKREDRQSGRPGDGLGGPFQIDRDRILYSMAFRRLAGVTQVVSPGEGEIFHNRLTHSLKVAQIARRLAEKFASERPDVVADWGGLDADVTEAAGLAHDLGHPPFGHIAEEELQSLVSQAINSSKAPGASPVEGYEGNAQSFRILTELSLRRPESMLDPDPASPGKEYGLDLTRATLNATLKYPWGVATEPGQAGEVRCLRLRRHGARLRPTDRGSGRGPGPVARSADHGLGRRRHVLGPRH